ncbi:MAG: hypothetical protein ACR2NG_04660 [Acidimicrobiia bacterium]
MFTRACQVVPEIASFAVDDGFTYGIPDDLEPEVGSRVRVRVSGRRMRGYVTVILDEVPDKKLVGIDGVVGDLPSFAPDDLPLLRWCATHYVSPVSTVLKRTVPPNLPRRKAALNAARPPIGNGSVTSIVPAVGDDAAVAASLSGIADDESAMVIVPSVLEAQRIARTLTATFGARVTVAHSDLAAKDATKAWVKAAAEPGTLLVGTREVVLWPMPTMARAVVVQDARRVMKSPATPTFGVREIMHKRAEERGVPLTFISPLPSLEVLSWATAESTPEGRCWPLVEVADRSEEPPTGSSLLERTRTAIAAAAKSNGKAFVLVGRRGYARAFRCTNCGDLRRCEQCGSAVGRDSTCARCGHTNGACAACGGVTWQHLGAGIGSVVDDLRRSLPQAVGTAGEGMPVTVGTERDLRIVEAVRLAVAVDIDSMTMAPHYRAGEDALRLLVRLANLVERGRGNRCLVQTADPTQPVVEALRSGRYEAFMRTERGARTTAGFPPSGSLIALEVSPPYEGVDDLVASLRPHAQVHGPAEAGDRMRYLIQGRNLDALRVHMRPVVRTLRDRGSKVRVDVDPIDL